jgi:hypothetical protein
MYIRDKKIDIFLNKPDSGNLKNSYYLYIINRYMRIRRKFLQLTQLTFTGTEEKIKKYLPNGIKKDEWGNYFLTIGDNFTTMFTCHLDTAL